MIDTIQQQMRRLKGPFAGSSTYFNECWNEIPEVYSYSSHLPRYQLNLSLLADKYDSMVFGIAVILPYPSVDVGNKKSESVPSPRLVCIELNPGPGKKKNNQSKNRHYKNKPNTGTRTLAPYIATAVFNKPIICKIPKGLQLFPDILDTHSKTVIDLGLSGTTASQHTYHLNSPAKFFGPQINWTGAFADNVPAGLSYLLSSNTNAGSTSPYFYCITDYVEAVFELVNIQNSVSCYATVVPSFQVSFNGTTQSQLAEQRGAVQVLLPALGSSMAPTVIKGRYSVQDILGIKTTEVYNNQNYRQIAGSLPPISIYLHLVTASTDGVTNCAVQQRVTFTYHHRLQTTNNFLTSVPS